VHIKTILVPVDLSDASQAAMRRAVSLASSRGARIHWLHVVVVPPAPALYPAFSMPPELGEYTETLRKAHQEGFDQALESFDGSVTAERTLVLGTSAATEIVGYAQAHDVDLIVMGTHGHSGFRRLVLGSVAEGVIRRSPCAVMTVPPHAAEGDRLNHVVAGIDFSDVSEAVIAAARELAAQDGAELTLVHAVTPPNYPLLDIGEMGGALIDPMTLTESARSALQSAAESSGGPEVSESLAVLDGNADHAIPRFVEEHRVDLVVVGSHGHTGIGRVLLGSVAERLLRHVDCPVLIVRASETD
jgi:nucleotide-binding universal stress UspA family protein